MDATYFGKMSTYFANKAEREKTKIKTNLRGDIMALASRILNANKASDDVNELKQQLKLMRQKWDDYGFGTFE
jgi:DNA-binding transcriptional regulator GbsR (MarR family)